MRKSVGLPLLAVIAAFFVAIAYYEQRAEPIVAAPFVPQAAVAVDAEEVAAPKGFAHANWTVDAVDDLEDPHRRVEDGPPAKRKEPTWAGSDIIMPEK
jgi:hypothetical protein